MINFLVYGANWKLGKVKAMQMLPIGLSDMTCGGGGVPGVMPLQCLSHLLACPPLLSHFSKFFVKFLFHTRFFFSQLTAVLKYAQVAVFWASMVTSMRLLLFSSVTLVAPTCTCTVLTNTSHALQLACMTVHVYIVQMKAKGKTGKRKIF